MNTRQARTMVAAAAAAIALLAATGAALAAGGSARSSGPDYTYGANPFVDASAAVHVVKDGNGGTTVTLDVHGVDADAAGQRFGAHVHRNPCGASGSDAGSHYQHAGATGSLEDIEVWLDFTVNRGGNGHSIATRPWSLDETSPRSVIIHALPTAPDTGAAGARLACIDLDGDH